VNGFWASILLVGGLIILWKSADLLVAGAVRLAKSLGVSPLVIGLTVVAMGTSSPEVAASIAASVRGAGDIAIGNIYGSNIANLALVGGLCAVIFPIEVRSRLLKREIPVMLLSAFLLLPVLYNQHLARLEGVGLLGLFVVLIILTVYMARKETQNRAAPARGGSYDEADKKAIGANGKRSVLYTVIGLAGLALGADMTVRGAVFIGRQIGLSEAVIGLTIIAIGTSLPELVTCVAAAFKKQHDIAIGNLVGSNVFNTLLVAGGAGVIRPFDIAARLIGVDYWVMVAISVGFVVMAVIGKRISRVDGSLLLAAYAGYIIYLLT